MLEQFKQRTGASTIMEEGSTGSTELQLAVLQGLGASTYLKKRRNMKIEPRTSRTANEGVRPVPGCFHADAEALGAFRNAIYSKTHFMADTRRKGESGSDAERLCAGFVEAL